MQQALENLHFKKIWEEVITNKHPSERTLIDALLSEACYDGCLFIQDGYIGMPHVFPNDCGNAYAFNFCSDYQYENNRKISFFDDEERKKYDVNTGVLLEEYTEEVLNKERVLQHILGRPITLFDILNLLQKNTKNGEFALMTNCIVLCNIDATRNTSNDIFPYFVKKICDINNESILLEEQSPEAWVEISKLINK